MKLAMLNALPEARAREALARCCGTLSWVERMCAARPFAAVGALFATAAAEFWAGGPAEWREAFTHHPKIGDLDSLRERFGGAAGPQNWAASEQSEVRSAPEATLQALAQGNRDYEARFGYIFIVRAAGLSAEQMLAQLNERRSNSPEIEIYIAATEQAGIMFRRLVKLLAEE